MRWLAWLLPLAALLGGAGWGVSDHLEQRNDFCVSCHLPDGAVLHGEIREDFDRVIPVNLAGVHGRGWVEERDDSAFRCIDCHAGAGIAERSKVKLLAARDAVRYVFGSFDEPEGMPFELAPATCLGCHPSFRHSAAPGWTLQAYHGLPVHDGPEAPRCVACHAVHEGDGDAFAYFMARPRVTAQCRECHVEGDGVALPSVALGVALPSVAPVPGLGRESGRLDANPR